jgi:membrane protein implicated in regulation of membrane protease activity
MIDWIRDHAWATWLGIAVVLAVVEILSLDLVLLMFALGALAAAAAAGLGAPIWVTLPLFALVSVALLALVRPSVVAKLHDGPTLQTGHANLVGAAAVVVEPVDRRAACR